ncbi:MAG: TatD family hydrolase [Myxococcales bacterium]|nr:TatD family hydrolase [Myxococcales bacterium]USN51456.1 MAG: TatD family hydrolase [Myxococcales bacterium]
MIIDSHCHIHDEKFNSDRDEVIKRAQDENITHLITIGCDIFTTEKAHAVAERYENIYFSAGFHPHEAQFLDDENYQKLRELAQAKKCVAIGECGLDYYYNHSKPKEQEAALVKQIELAHELGLPLIIHLRDAFVPFMDIMEAHLKEGQKVLIHCFSGSLEEAHIHIESGFYISLSGIITFKKPGDLPQVAKEIPLEKLLIETDCPYLAPLPYRGKRNEPHYIHRTLDAVAQARGETLEIIENQIYQNTLDFFNI